MPKSKIKVSLEENILINNNIFMKVRQARKDLVANCIKYDVYEEEEVSS